MKKVTFDKANRRHTIITTLGITVLVFLILASIAGATQDPMVRNNKENAQTDLNKIDEAINAYGQKMMQDSNVDNLKKADEAAEAYEKAFKINMQNLDKLKKSDEAAKAYDKAIEINPQNSAAWYNRAHIYSLINNQDQSILNLNKAIELYSSYKEKAKKETTLKDYGLMKSLRNLLSKTE